MKIQSNSDHLKQEPIVSVAVPVYNGEAFIEECLLSILNQTFLDWECIIVNNASTDGTIDIVRKFVDLDERFKLIDREEFVSLVDNWNRLYQYISKESLYLKVVQADDIIYPESLEEMVSLMEKNLNVGICSSYRIEGFDVNCDGLNIFDGPVFSGKELLYRHLKSEIDITGSVTTPLFRKQFLKKLPTYPKIFDDRDYHMDTLLAYEMMLISDVGFVFKILSLTRVHEGADTVQTAVKYRTFLCSKENRLYRFKQVFKELNSDYRSHRLTYAYFLFKERLKGHKDCLEWHKEQLLRPFSISERIQAVVLYNGIIWRLLSPFKNRRRPKKEVISMNS